eukprot:TRINITY_DN2506_c1_g2_i1.p1 TRINITY_DN2506_c1_g2~~TRINITY_DN2506_c1_g2_i1.p1  ORF type:complete len:164 (-),score=39.14 TRINITY_DN2506_c1_g2_i1:5-496(-)
MRTLPLLPLSLLLLLLLTIPTTTTASPSPSPSPPRRKPRKIFIPTAASHNPEIIHLDLNAQLEKQKVQTEAKRLMDEQYEKRKTEIKAALDGIPLIHVREIMRKIAKNPGWVELLIAQREGRGDPMSKQFVQMRNELTKSLPERVRRMMSDSLFLDDGKLKMK